MVEAALSRFALAHHALDDIADETSTLRDSDEALSSPWAPECVVEGVPSHTLRLRRGAMSLLESIPAHARPQASLIRLWAVERAAPAVNEWLRQPLSRLERGIAPEEVATVCAGLELRGFLALSFFRIVAESWLTTRRLAGHAEVSV